MMFAFSILTVKELLSSPTNNHIYGFNYKDLLNKKVNMGTVIELHTDM